MNEKRDGATVCLFIYFLNRTPLFPTSSLHHLVDFALDVQLRMFRLHAFQLDGDFLSDRDVCAWRAERKREINTDRAAAGKQSTTKRSYCDHAEVDFFFFLFSIEALKCFIPLTPQQSVKKLDDRPSCCSRKFLN